MNRLPPLSARSAPVRQTAAALPAAARGRAAVKKVARPTALLLALLLPLAAPVWAAPSAEELGLAIAAEADRRDGGFQDFTAEVLMVLRNRDGAESERRLRSRTLEVDGDGDKSLVIFDAPADVKGTAFLSYTHAVEPDDQWLYLPALKRVKRIAGANRSGPFMGSEFAYEDISSQELAKYRYRYLRDDRLDGEDCYVVERRPVYADSGYTRQQVWFDRQHYRPLKIEFYDRRDTPLKTLHYRGYRLYAGRYWRADEMQMVNHQSGKSTDLRWRDYRFGTGLDARDFDHASLQRAR